ncbi:MAG: hypothetical protein Q3983_02505 [Capnocytophaga sp.]|nr:hypothetical protein [Capnocytophaga sp.]
MRKIVFYVCLSLLLLPPVLAQDSLFTKSLENDSLKHKNDSIFHSLQINSKKSKFRKKLHQLFFNSTNVKQDSSVRKKKVPPRDWTNVQGKTIRNIKIVVLEPLGYDEKDSTKQPNRWENLGNIFHNKTKNKIVERLLLFHKNSLLDSTIVKETERVLRSQTYIRRANIEAFPTASKDSVDVTISVLDSWSLYADATGSFSEGTIRLFERNFLGQGHQLAFRYSQEISGNVRPSFGFEYRIPNIYATTVNTMVSYSIDFDRYYEKYWAVWRPYYSIYTRWAGGITLSERSFREDFKKNDTIIPQSLKIRYKNVWASGAFPISKNEQKNRVTNFVLSTRFYQTRYIDKPLKELDENQFFSDRYTQITSIGISQMGYEQDRYIFRIRDIEDIPVGRNISLLSGFRYNLNKISPYLGFKAMYGNYWKFGYFSTDFQIGSFFKEENKQTTIRGELIYFSPLFHLGKWNFRQFFKWQYVNGLSRKNYFKDRITLNGNTGIIGFNSPTLSGTRKSVFTFQTQSYSPFSLLGFRINPFFTADIGLIGEGQRSILKDQVFTKWGIGLYVTNDYIPLGNFQFSFVFFPRIPGVGNYIQELSGRSNDDFRLPNFNYQTPEIIRYE